MIKKILIWITPIVIAGVIAFVAYRQSHKNYYDFIVLSGATPVAIDDRVPDKWELRVDGMVKKEYHLSGEALNALAATRIRTKEVSPDGKFQGAYIYLGIPVLHILEGIAPLKPDSIPFNGPIDILLTFHSDSGRKSFVSLNEILMADDSSPITLAYSREELLPTNEVVKETYSKNLNREALSGFRLIFPKEPDTYRFLDNITRISYGVVPSDEDLLPVRKKRFKCASDSLTCVHQNNKTTATFDGVEEKEITDWIRVGHGHGFDDIATGAGYDLKSFLRANFPKLDKNDFFLFVACDGYRALFSGREIFMTGDGTHMTILSNVNGEMPQTGLMLAPTKDFFNDRAMWGVSHVVWVPASLLD